MRKSKCKKVVSFVFAAALDSLGILGANKRRITGRKWAAVAIMLAGVLSIALLTGEAGAHFSLLAVLASLLRGVAVVISRQLNGQLGIRAGLWKTKKQALELIEKGDLTNE